MLLTLRRSERGGRHSSRRKRRGRRSNWHYNLNRGRGKSKAATQPRETTTK
jgi:hypothetical protein